MAKTQKKNGVKKNGTKRKLYFYHVTDAANLEAILRDGLKGGTKPRNRGETMSKPSIFVVTKNNQEFFKYVAVNQIWPFSRIDSIAAIRINPTGITGKVLPDLVAERGAVWQRIIEQEVIEPKYLHHEGTTEINYPGDVILELMRSQAKRKWTPEEWAVADEWMHESLRDMQRRYEEEV